MPQPIPVCDPLVKLCRIFDLADERFVERLYLACVEVLRKYFRDDGLEGVSGIRSREIRWLVSLPSMTSGMLHTARTPASDRVEIDDAERHVDRGTEPRSYGCIAPSSR